MPNASYGLGLVVALGLGLLPVGAAVGQTLPLEESPAAEEGVASPQADPFDAGSPLPTPNPLPLLDRSGQPQTQVFDEYRLGPGDAIFITVQRFPDLSFQATLDIQGNIIVPLAGAINLADLTLEEARQTIFRAYDQYVVNPQVSITLTAQRPVQVTVLGEVTRPGFYPLPAPQIATALLTAGGSTAQADLRQVRVQRSLTNGQTLERSVDLFTPLKAGEALPNVRLQDGDVLIIPRLDPAQIGEYDRNLVATSTLARPEITIRVLNYAGGGRGIEARFNNVVVPNGSRFLDALAQAGVNPDLAAYRRIAVLRFNPETGAADTITVDAIAAVNGDPSQNIALQDNDVLVVDRNLQARITHTLSTFTQPFRDVLGFLLFFDQIGNASRSLFGP